MLLNEQQTEKLLKLPETGMGYHLVDVRLNDGRVLENKTILNCKILHTQENINADDIENISISE